MHSPDGHFLAVHRASPGSDMWALRPRRETPSRDSSSFGQMLLDSGRGVRIDAAEAPEDLGLFFRAQTMFGDQKQDLIFLE